MTSQVERMSVDLAPVPLWHKQLLALLSKDPPLRADAARLPEGRRSREALADVVANATVAFARLAEQDRTEAATAKSLAWYGVRQLFDGRRVGTKLNVRDVMSPHAQRRKGLRVQQLDRFDAQNGCWREVLVEDRNATPADVAASRIDFPAFLATLSRRDRKIALKLANGESTGRVAKMFRLSAGRISQLRSELRTAWLRFHGKSPDNPPLGAMA